MARVAGAESGRLVFARTPAGAPVAECELDAGDLGLVLGLAREATARGCALLWVHSSRRPGPGRFHGPARVPAVQHGQRSGGDPLPRPASHRASSCGRLDGLCRSEPTPPGPVSLAAATKADGRPGGPPGVADPAAPPRPAGDDRGRAGAYLELGGTVEEECGGWERALPS